MEFRALWSQSHFQRFFLLLIFKNEKWTFYFCPFLKILFQNLKKEFNSFIGRTRSYKNKSNKYIKNI
jgi:hypothetical protein